jgi:D-inositol-3-phosphate glycosyltransferase
MRPLRLALISIHTCPMGQLGTKDTGGMNVYVSELAIALGKLGHQVDIFTHAHSEEHPAIMEITPNVRLIHLTTRSPDKLDKISLYPYLPEITNRLEEFRTAQGYSYDAMFSHYWLSGWIGQKLKNRWNVPHLVMFHTLGRVKNTLGTGENEPELRTYTESALMQDADRIIASTPREKYVLQNLRGAKNNNIAVIPCGVNLKLFHPVKRREARQQVGLTNEKCLLSVGRIEALKGLDRLIAAIALLQDIPNVKLLICGGGNPNEIENLRAVVTRLGVSGRVELREPIPQEQLAAYYSATDIFVLPSYYESFGMVALEALACGTPVVTTNIGDLRYIIDSGVTGYVAKDNSPGQLSRTLRLALATDFGHSDAIRNSVKRYRWNRIAAAVVKEIAKLQRLQHKKL